ncbi:MAG TPA: DUF3352 domain-containing protein [Solirubrobacteraceae bacterium]|nr:DUF3352 domain-containing protein [Solirubrobacteraceae bacterium]
MPLSSRLLRPAAALCAAAVLPLAAACGDDDGNAGADPAALAPARAPMYVEVNLNPGDDVKELARKLSGEEDPGGAIKRLIEKEARKSDKDFKYSEKVEPWLGDRAGLFVSGFSAGGDSPPAAVVVATKDVDKARETLEEQIRKGESGGPKPQVVERTHKGTKYLVDTSDDEAVAFVEDYAVFGNDAAVKLAIETPDGESLAENGEYEKAREAVEEDGVGFAYIRFSQIFSALGPQGEAAKQLLSGYGETFAVGLDGDPDSIDLESAALGVSEDNPYAGPGEVVASLPASSWGAYGTADFGKQIQRYIEKFGEAAASGLGQSPEQLFGQLERELGFDVRRELEWIDDIGVFVLGDKLTELGGGLVAKTSDPAATRRSIPRLVTFLEGAADVQGEPLRRAGVVEGTTLRSTEIPVPIHLALTEDDRFIIVASDGALAQTLQATDKLGDSQPWKDAAGRLGDGIQPSFFVNFEPIPALIEAAGVDEDDPTYQQFKKALQQLTTLAGGGKREGDVQRGRLVVGVR